VIQGKDSKAADPFVSCGSEPGVSGDVKDSSEGAHSACSLQPKEPAGDAEEVTEGGPDKADTAMAVLSPRADRVQDPISAENAQAVLPPSACVFVAK
jgi:hypothetical protein